MPVKPCTKDGKPGHKWGDKGVCFTGKDSRARAAAVGRAIFARGAEKSEASQREIEDIVGDMTADDLLTFDALLRKEDFSSDDLESGGGLLEADQRADLRRCTENGESGWKVGETGACFTGPDAKKRALLAKRLKHDERFEAFDEGDVAALESDELDEILENVPAAPDEEPEGVIGWVKKTDDELRIVWGEVYVPAFPDTQGDFMSAEEIQKMAHRFLEASLTQAVDANHDNVEKDGCFIVESFIARKGDPDFIPGAWVVGMKVGDDQLWDDVKAGKINGFSMQAKVFVTEKTIEIEIPEEVIGLTQVASSGHVHRHTYTVVFTDKGDFIGGRTSTDVGAFGPHWHDIHGRSITGVALATTGEPLQDDRHFHRYSFLDKLLGGPHEESPGIGEPSEEFVEIA